MKISNTLKAIITACIVILLSLYIYRTNGDFDSHLVFIPYACYVGGILWVLIEHRMSSDPHKSFKDFFLRGFRFFILVTLIMVIFTYVFLKFNPAEQAEMLSDYRNILLKDGNKTPAEVESGVNQMKEYFIPMMISRTIMGYLLIGGMVTGIVSGIFMQAPAPKYYTDKSKF